MGLFPTGLAVSASLSGDKKYKTKPLHSTSYIHQLSTIEPGNHKPLEEKNVRKSEAFASLK